MPVRKVKYIEITKDINAIPAGVYKVFNQQEEAIEFAVGSKIVFGVSSNAKIYFRSVPFMKAMKELMKPEQFVDRYYDLLKNRKKEPCDPNKPFTYCMMDPSIAREAH